MTKSGIIEVLDMACGSGRHAVALSSMGIRVTAFDSSESMIAAAKNHAAGLGESISFHLADMQNFASVIDGQFASVLCLGNSLALLPSFKDLEKTVSDVYNILCPGGTFVFQVLNFQEIMHSGFRFFPIKGGTTPAGNDVVFSRFYEHSDRERSTLIATSFVKSGNEWETSISTQQVLHTNQEVLNDALSKAGFQDIEIYSDYHQSTFSPESSRSMVVRARFT